MSASCSLPIWQAVKLTLFALCVYVHISSIFVQRSESNKYNDMIQYLQEITWKLIILSNNTIGGILKSKTKN